MRSQLPQDKPRLFEPRPRLEERDERDACRRDAWTLTLRIRTTRSMRYVLTTRSSRPFLRSRTRESTRQVHNAAYSYVDPTPVSQPRLAAYFAEVMTLWLVRRCPSIPGVRAYHGRKMPKPRGW